MAVTMMILIMTILGLQMLPETMSALCAPYVYGTALVIAFWMLRTQVRRLLLK